MRSPAFQLLLHAALRTLIDELGVRTFNAGALLHPFCPWRSSEETGLIALHRFVPAVPCEGAAPQCPRWARSDRYFHSAPLPWLCACSHLQHQPSGWGGGQHACGRQWGGGWQQWRPSARRAGHRQVGEVPLEERLAQSVFAALRRRPSPRAHLLASSIRGCRVGVISRHRPAAFPLLQGGVAGEAVQPGQRLWGAGGVWGRLHRAH